MEQLSLVLSNGIYIDSLNLKAVIQNQIRRLAAIRNPIFIKILQSVCRTLLPLSGSIWERII